MKLPLNRLKFYVKWLLRPYYRATADWKRDLNEELRFWDGWLHQRGAPRLQPEEFSNLLRPDRALDGEVLQAVDDLSQSSVRILDVGAGPISVLGTGHPTKTIDLVPCDVLAPEYDSLLEKYGIVPAVRTVFAEAEKLERHFSKDSFDVVHAKNAIDHVHDPVEAIKQMIRVAKPAGVVILRHLENEGKNEHYHGLHQWDFTVEGSDFVIHGRSGATNVTQSVSHMAVLQATREPHSHARLSWVVVHARKSSSEAAAF